MLPAQPCRRHGRYRPTSHMWYPPRRSSGGRRGCAPLHFASERAARSRSQWSRPRVLVPCGAGLASGAADCRGGRPRLRCPARRGACPLAPPPLPCPRVWQPRDPSATDPHRRRHGALPAMSRQLRCAHGRTRAARRPMPVECKAGNVQLPAATGGRIARAEHSGLETQALGGVGSQSNNPWRCSCGLSPPIGRHAAEAIRVADRAARPALALRRRSP